MVRDCREPRSGLHEQYVAARDPLHPEFRFRMSLALLAGFIVTYPMNWWLVARHLKHGMTTVRPASAKASAADMPAPAVPRFALLGMTLLSLAIFAGRLLIAI